MEKRLPSRLLTAIAIVAQIILVCHMAFTQPVNDDCTNAIEILVGKDEASSIRVDGDTRGATASEFPLSVCSGSFYTDDVWFKFSTADTLPTKGLIVRVYFDPLSTSTDLPYIGMGIYETCDSLAIPLHCFSGADPEQKSQFLSFSCLDTSTEYYVRVWSGGNTTETEGTFKISVYEHPQTKIPVWWETFDGGLELNGWSTFGSCRDPDSNHNAAWQYLPDGLIDKGAYIYQGAGINSETRCDGAVGVDSDYNNTYGHDPPAFGNFPCESPSRHILVSPEIDTRPWNRRPVYISWIQAIRNHTSTYYFAYRTKDEGGDWNDWDSIEINMEFPINGNFEPDNVQQHFIPAVAEHDFMQIMFIYNANFYMWAIDDVKILTPEEYYDLKIAQNAIAPWYKIPGSHVYPYYSGMQLQNASYESHANVKLSHTITRSQSTDTIYHSELLIDTIHYQDPSPFHLFEPIVSLPHFQETYSDVYIVKEDKQDNHPQDNMHNSTFQIGGTFYFAHENGFYRSVAPAKGLYHTGAPLSYGYGNIFKLQFDEVLGFVVWGVNNPGDMAGKTVSLYLIEWTDTNKDQRAQPEERKFIGYRDYTFEGDEGANAIITSVFENFEKPGSQIIGHGGRQYIVMVEYVATSTGDPQFFLLASEERDYTGLVVASDSAYQRGLIADPIYMTAMQFSPDGNINNIDFEVRDFGSQDEYLHFGDGIVPFIRLGMFPVSTLDESNLKKPFSVFPNPAKDILQVVFKEDIGNIRLSLVDNLGRILYSSEVSSLTFDHTSSINISSFAAGQYILQVESRNSTYSMPVIIAQ